VGQRSFYFEVRPTVGEAIDGRLFGNVESIRIDLVDFGEGLDQVGRVTFVSAQLRSDGVRVDCDVQIISHLSFSSTPSPSGRGPGLGLRRREMGVVVLVVLRIYALTLTLSQEEREMKNVKMTNGK